MVGRRTPLLQCSCDDVPLCGALGSHRGDVRSWSASARRFGLRYVYTPQAVVHGTVQATGSDRHAIGRAIEGLRKVKEGQHVDFAFVEPDSVVSHLELYAE